MHDPERFQAETAKAINDLYEINKQHLNRQLAFEALMHSMLHRVQPEALVGLLEEYEQACDRLAGELEPKNQMPHLWLQWSAEIEALQKARRTPPKLANPDAAPG